MFTVYIIKSERTGKHYIGSTKDINDRIQRHNAGREKSTKYGKPWKLIFCENFENRTEAVRREKEVKSYKSGDAFKKLISGRSSDG